MDRISSFSLNFEHELQASQNDNDPICSKAAIVLQAYMRGQKVRDQTIYPFEIRNAFNIIAFLNQLDDNTESRFCRLIAQKIQCVLIEKKINQDVHYGKNILYQLDNNFCTIPFTFYVRIDADQKRAQISINQTKNLGSLIGEGSYKIVHGGINFYIPFGNEVKRQKIAHENIAIARANLENDADFDKDLLPSNEKHNLIWNGMKQRALPGRITEPQQLRQHMDILGGIKKELTQRRYASDLYRLSKCGYFRSNPEGVCVDFSSRLRFMEEIFETIDSISLLGYAHRDIKPDNIFLDVENETIQTYVHDFDLLLNRCLGSNDVEFLYWDIVGQSGLFSPASDIVGAIYTCLHLMMDNSIKDVIYKKKLWDTDHSLFYLPVNQLFQEFVKGKLNGLIAVGALPKLKTLETCQDPESVLQSLYTIANSRSCTKAHNLHAKEAYSQVRSLLKLLQLFKTYIEKELEWEQMLFGSFLLHFSGVTLEEYLTQRNGNSRAVFGKFCKGASAHFKAELLKKIGNSIYDRLQSSPQELEDRDIDNIFDDLSRLYARASSLPLTETHNFYKIYYRFDSFKHIRQLFRIHLPKGYDPSLFRLLDSEIFEEHLAGQEMVYKLFGRAQDIKDAIIAIRAEYMSAP